MLLDDPYNLNVVGGNNEYGLGFAVAAPPTLGGKAPSYPLYGGSGSNQGNVLRSQYTNSEAAESEFETNSQF
jgi:hypothetical protein